MSHGTRQALLDAAAMGNLAEVQILLQSGTDPNYGV